MERLTEAKARELIRAGLGDQLRQVASDCAAPICWFDPEAPDEKRILHNGTISFVHTGSRVIGITAGHVLSQYLRDQKNLPRIICQVGGARVDAHEHVIALSERLDIGTIELSREEVTQIGRTVHESAFPWPPKPPDKGCGVFFAGFPKQARRERPGSIEWGIDSCLLVVGPGWGPPPPDRRVCLSSDTSPIAKEGALNHLPPVGTAAAMIRRTGSHDPDVVFGGGRLMSAAESFWRRRVDGMRRECPGAAVKRPELSPAVGAAIMAAHADGCPPARFFGTTQRQ